MIPENHHINFSTLDEWFLAETLGRGASAKVKKANRIIGGEGKEKASRLDSQQYAIKILKEKSVLGSREALRKEVNILSQVNHPNIIRLEDYNENGILTKRGNIQTRMYMVLELVSGGELFDYVATCGSFSESVARFYFHQLIDGLEYLHKRGIAHRDLKPENLLLDQNFDLKVSDFGFSTHMNRTLSTHLGTKSYMAPELFLMMPYSGNAIDLFATGVILFIMVMACPPFNSAERTDPYYKNICQNRYDLFWSHHMKWKNNKSTSKGDIFQISDTFKDLINALLALNPTHRITLAELKAHPWYLGEIAEKSQFVEDFIKRRNQIKKNLEAERERRLRERERARGENQGNQTLDNLYTGYKKFRSIDQESGKKQTEQASESSNKHLDFDSIEKEYPKLKTKTRVLKKIEADAALSPLNILTPLHEDFLLKTLLDYSIHNFNETSISEKTFKIQVKLIGHYETTFLSIKIFRFEEDCCLIGFERVSGSLKEYYEEVRKIEEFVRRLEKI